MKKFVTGTKVLVTKLALFGDSAVKPGETFEGYIVNLGGLQKGMSLVLQVGNTRMNTSPVVSVAQAPRFQGKETCIFDTQTSRYHCVEL